SLDWVEGCSDSRTPGENSTPTPLKHLHWPVHQSLRIWPATLRGPTHVKHLPSCDAGVPLGTLSIPAESPDVVLMSCAWHDSSTPWHPCACWPPPGHTRRLRSEHHRLPAARLRAAVLFGCPQSHASPGDEAHAFPPARDAIPSKTSSLPCRASLNPG